MILTVWGAVVIGGIATYNTFNVQRHLTSASTHRVFRASAMQTWREVTAAA